MSRLTRVSILLAFFFGLDKVIAFLRSLIIARQFGLSRELDAFNAANNIPDMLFALISGGALAMAFIPVLAETRTREGREKTWELFSRIANLAFLVTAGLAVIVAILAAPLVRNVIAPGFQYDQQVLVIHLMQLNLIATLIFSISGLVMAGLQANQHFLLPAMAPLLYNIGQIFGALILSPEKGYHFGGVVLPAFGLGVQGLVYGVILGAILHLGVQIPGLVKYRFRWTPAIGLLTQPVRKVLSLLGPRLLTMLMIQLIFLVRDNLASRLSAGAVSSLTYGWMIMQVPETLVGTAIGIALLPTLSEMVAREEWDGFQMTIQRAMQVILAITLPISVLLALGLPPLLSVAFDFGLEGTQLLVWVTRGFLAGLVGQCLMELAVRSFYARQDAITPLITGVINFVIYILSGMVLFRFLGAPGISLADSIAFTSQAVLLLYLLNRRLVKRLVPGPSIFRAIAAAGIGGVVVILFSNLPQAASQPLVFGVIGLAMGGAVALLPILKEIRLLLRL
ncbi:MAG: murein biosynthesis integral membrane protein MurJ [Anaerolineaceae bacterium]|nr:murein biosynthesis integral membrane protein MurJ [Anaerolineaceae bacterium]